MLIAQAIPAVQIATRVAKLKNHNQTYTFSASIYFEQKNSVYKRIPTSCKYSYIIQGEARGARPTAGWKTTKGDPVYNNYICHRHFYINGKRDWKVKLSLTSVFLAPELQTLISDWPPWLSRSSVESHFHSKAIHICSHRMLISIQYYALITRITSLYIIHYYTVLWISYPLTKFVTNSEK